MNRPYPADLIARLVRGTFPCSKSSMGQHSRMERTFSDLYLTLADEVMNVGLGKFPMATKKLSGLLV